MKALASLSAAAILATGLAAAPAQAEPGGCLKYGAAGAVGGHLLHHGVLGALGGCAAGMYRRHEYRKDQSAALRQQRYENNNNDQGYGQGQGNNQGYNQGYRNGSSSDRSFDNGNQSQPFAR